MNKNFLYIIVFLLNLNLYASSTKKVITFAPLPVKDHSKLVEEFLPLFKYIEKTSGIKTKFVYEKDYGQIIEKFKQNKIDIALFGPLPYLKLNQTYQFNEPIVTFKQQNGDSNYRCVLVQFGKDKIDFNNNLKVALTQPLSTCGYYMTNILLQKSHNLELKNQKYKYLNSHTNAIVGVLEGDFDIAGAKDSSADAFHSLGMRVVAKSEKLPGFSLVVNTNTLSKKQIKVIQDLILSIPQSNYKKWHGISKNGFEKASKNTYDNFIVDFKKIPTVGNIDEK